MKQARADAEGADADPDEWRQPVLKAVKIEPRPYTAPVEAPRESRSWFRYGTASQVHEDKISVGGEDAWVASNNLLVLADGGVKGKGYHSYGGPNRHLYAKKLVADMKMDFDLDPS